MHNLLEWESWDKTSIDKIRKIYDLVNDAAMEKKAREEYKILIEKLSKEYNEIFCNAYNEKLHDGYGKIEALLIIYSMGNLAKEKILLKEESRKSIPPSEQPTEF